MTPPEREGYLPGGKVFVEAGKKIYDKLSSAAGANLDDAVTKTGAKSKGKMTRADGSTYALMGDDLLKIQNKKSKIEGGVKTLLVSSPLMGGAGYLAGLSSKEESKVKENKTSTVTDITSGTMNSAFSKASKNPTAYVFMKQGQPHFKYKGKSVPFALATEEDDVVLDMTPRSKKAKGGSTDDDAATYEEYRKRFIEETIQERKEQEEAEKERRAGNKRRTAETLKEKMTEGEKRAIAEETMRLNDEAAERYYADKERLGKAEGSLMIPQEGMPVDTYDNIPPEEMEEAMASQLPDDEMEDSYTSYVMDESLDDEEQEYLATVLESDPRLSDILDKVITVASEFSGQGEVAGPGTGVSDSIPARLSDGEFVMTKKATDQLGADNLQVMMDDAERAYDGGYQMKAMGGVMDEEDPEDPMMSKTQEEIEKLMMGANRMPSLQ